MESLADNSAAIEVYYRADEECGFLYVPFGDIADPYLVRPWRIELLFHVVDWISDFKAPSAFCACPDAVETHLAHQPSDHCNGHVQASFLHDDGDLVRPKALLAFIEDVAYTFLERRNSCLEPCGIAFIVFDMPVEESPGDTECIAEDVDVVFYGVFTVEFFHCIELGFYVGVQSFVGALEYFADSFLSFKLHLQDAYITPVRRRSGRCRNNGGWSQVAFCPVVDGLSGDAVLSGKRLDLHIVAIVAG